MIHVSHFILNTKQLILWGYCKKLHTDKLAGAERVQSVTFQLQYELLSTGILYI